MHASRNRSVRRGNGSQIDAHGLAAFQCHAFAYFPSFSTNLFSDILVLTHRFDGKVGMKQERSVLDFESDRKVRALRDGGLELAVSDEAPRAAL
jgi:hypothetical protein